MCSRATTWLQLFISLYLEYLEGVLLKCRTPVESASCHKDFQARPSSMYLHAPQHLPKALGWKVGLTRNFTGPSSEAQNYLVQLISRSASKFGVESRVGQERKDKGAFCNGKRQERSLARAYGPSDSKFKISRRISLRVLYSANTLKAHDC
jgi:hypothetical protein